ncbi:MAG: hypothetical protein KJ000_19930 [Pirellulaceae bacterium]|nr:hypothetical protein [Pirellulaceae bacterium]
MQTKFSTVMASIAILSLCGSVAVGQYGPVSDAGYVQSGVVPGVYHQPAVFHPQGTGLSDVRLVSHNGQPAFAAISDRQATGTGVFSQSPTAIPAGYSKPQDIKGDDDCKGGSCKGGSGKGDSCKCDTCCPSYRVRAYGEFLYLRARDVEVPYAVETNSNLATLTGPPIQTSPIALVDQDFEPAFRAGFALCLDECSEIAVTYTLFESEADHFITRNPATPLFAIYPMVTHPATPNAITSSVEAAAIAGVNFDLIDLDFRRVLARSCQADLTGVVGVRYGKLEQTFAARFTDSLAQAENRAVVLSDIDFEGMGLKLGLDGDYYSTRMPVMVYMKGAISLLAGEFDANYQQTVQNNAGYGVNTAWSSGRIVPTFDLEVGGGFCSPGGNLRATAGYAYSAWTNVIKTEDWINGVQNNLFKDMGDSITFDGLVFRVEGRF